MARPVVADSATARCVSTGLLFCLIGGVIVAGAGCTLAPKVNVSEGVAKKAASELGTGLEGAAQKFGTEVARASEPYQEEVLARLKEFTASTNQLVQISRDMPRTLGETVTDRLLAAEPVQVALRDFTVLSRAPQKLAASIEQSPHVLGARLEALQAELTKSDGFLTQQRAALLESVKQEREALTESIRQERASVMKDINVLTKNAIDEVFAQGRVLVEHALWLIIVLVLVLWGLPFAAGFLLGRLVQKRGP